MEDAQILYHFNAPAFLIFPGEICYNDLQMKIHLETKNRFFLAAFLLFLGCVLLIIVLADRGSLPVVVYQLYAFPGGDKVGHFLLLGLLAGLAGAALPNPRMRIGAYTFPASTTWVAVGAVVEECSQLLFATRHAGWLDLSFSLAGVIAAAWFLKCRYGEPCRS